MTGSFDFLLEKKQYYVKNEPLSKEDLNFLTSATNECIIPAYGYRAYNISLRNTFACSNLKLSEAQNTNTLIYNTSANGLLTVNEDICAKLGFSITGRLPQNRNEIAINETLYNTYSLEGIIVHTLDENGIINSLTYEVHRFEDVIGRQIIVNHTDTGGGDQSVYQKTITGIIDTKCDRYYYTYQEIDSYCQKLFVSDDFFEEYSYAFVVTSNNKIDYKFFIDKINEYNTDKYILRFAGENINHFYAAVSIANDMSVFFIYVSALFLIFSILFLLKVIIDTLDKKTKQIGILKSIGIDFNGLLKIFFIQTLSILLPAFFLSIFTTLVANTFLNNFVTGIDELAKFPIWQFNLLPFLFVLIICVATAFLGCIFPLIKAAKRAPAETIRKGQRN